MFIRNESSDYSEKNIITNSKAINLQNYIRKNIPLTNFMEFSITELEENFIKLTVPIKPNGNHYNTAFGGSISTLGIVCCWALLQQKMNNDEQPGIIVIQESNTQYKKPARTDFSAECLIENPNDWQNFKDELNSNGKSKIELISKLYSEGNLIAVHKGSYFGLLKAR